jgi:lysophospholipase L1-like esterase
LIPSLAGLVLLLAPAAVHAQEAAATPAPLAAFPGQYAPGTSRFPVWPTGCNGLPDSERLACLESVALDFGALQRFAAANRELAPVSGGQQRVVFFGDSITDGWSHPDSGGFFPGKPYLNRGIGGQTTAQMLLRFRPDVVAHRPDAVVILAGTNDVAGNAGPATPDQILDNLATMAELATVHDIRVVLASLLPVCDGLEDEEGRPRVQTQARPPATLTMLNERLAAYAEKNGLVFLDYHAAMADAQGMLKRVLTDDGLHPNKAGYRVMAPLAEAAIEKALGTP